MAEKHFDILVGVKGVAAAEAQLKKVNNAAAGVGGGGAGGGGFFDATIKMGLAIKAIEATFDVIGAGMAFWKARQAEVNGQLLVTAKSYLEVADAIKSIPLLGKVAGGIANTIGGQKVRGVPEAIADAESAQKYLDELPDRIAEMRRDKELRTRGAQYGLDVMNAPDKDKRFVAEIAGLRKHYDDMKNLEDAFLIDLKVGGDIRIKIKEEIAKREIQQEIDLAAKANRRRQWEDNTFRSLTGGITTKIGRQGMWNNIRSAGMDAFGNISSGMKANSDHQFNVIDKLNAEKIRGIELEAAAGKDLAKQDADRLKIQEQYNAKRRELIALTQDATISEYDRTAAFKMLGRLDKQEKFEIAKALVSNDLTKPTAGQTSAFQSRFLTGDSFRQGERKTSAEIALEKAAAALLSDDTPVAVNTKEMVGLIKDIPSAIITALKGFIAIAPPI